MGPSLVLVSIGNCELVRLSLDFLAGLPGSSELDAEGLRDGLLNGMDDGRMNEENHSATCQCAKLAGRSKTLTTSHKSRTPLALHKVPALNQSGRPYSNKVIWA